MGFDGIFLFATPVEGRLESDGVATAMAVGSCEYKEGWRTQLVRLRARRSFGGGERMMVLGSRQG